MTRVVKRLHEVFPEHDSKLIWDAVDTVERLQGKERDVIIASFGLGDPDLIESEMSSCSTSIGSMSPPHGRGQN